VNAVTIVLADGDVLDVTRGDTWRALRRFEIESTTGAVRRVPVPTYVMPDVPKLSAGYYAAPEWISSISSLVRRARLASSSKPHSTSSRVRAIAALVRCTDDKQAVALTAALRQEAHPHGRGVARWTSPPSIHGHTRTASRAG
jgi:D-lactate dehydrogenase (cytochrome)